MTNSNGATPQLKHLPTFGLWADKNVGQPITKDFYFRIRSKHDANAENWQFTKGGDRSISTAYEVCLRLKPEDEWKPWPVIAQPKGFVLFCYAVAYCQWFYLVANLREKEISVKEVHLECHMAATQEFFVRNVDTEVTVTIDKDAPMPSDEDIAFAAERARVCPVARNVGGSFDKAVRCKVVTS